MGWSKEGRSYPTEQGGVWSSTTILGIKDKSGALTQWAANVTADYIHREIVRRAYEVADIELDEIVRRAKREARYQKEESGDIGTYVHKLVERWCKGEDTAISDSLDARIRNSFGLFLGWADEVDLTPLVVEVKVCSLRHEYGGTLDLIASGFFNKRWRKKRIYTLDTKTSKGIYETFGPQVASYTEAYTENAIAGILPRHKIVGEGIIRVGKEDGKPEFYDCSDEHEDNFRKFLSLKDAYITWNGRPR